IKVEPLVTGGGKKSTDDPERAGDKATGFTADELAQLAAKQAAKTPADPVGPGGKPAVDVDKLIGKEVARAMSKVNPTGEASPRTSGPGAGLAPHNPGGTLGDPSTENS